MNQINGIQLAPKIGTDFTTQYNVPETGVTNTSTLANASAAYNTHSVNFNDTKTEKNTQYNYNDMFQQMNMYASYNKAALGL